MTDQKPPHQLYFDSTFLSEWLRQQGDDSWWTVDGDSVLTELVDFPCPSGVLADVLTSTKCNLTFFDRSYTDGNRDQLENIGQIDQFVSKDDRGERVLELKWTDQQEQPWLLIEDSEMGKLSQALGEEDESP